MKRHLLILLALTVLIRGVMFISYPLGGQGEGIAFYRYNVEQILAGDWQIGNVRYAPGFPLFMAPVAALGDLFGRFDDRIELLFQLTLASLIPFLLYDILRTRHSPKAAFVVAILSLIDPFGLQWAHFFTPVWWVALNLVLALWLLHHAEQHIRSGGVRIWYVQRDWFRDWGCWVAGITRWWLWGCPFFCYRFLRGVFVLACATASFSARAPWCLCF